MKTLKGVSALLLVAIVTVGFFIAAQTHSTQTWRGHLPAAVSKASGSVQAEETSSRRHDKSADIKLRKPYKALGKITKKITGYSHKELRDKYILRPLGLSADDQDKAAESKV